MEKTLEKHMEEAFRIPGVSGVICTENSGLCLASQGNVSDQYSGSISALANQAARLCPTQNSPAPIIVLESEYGSLLIKKTDNITTAVFKSS
ncbi:ragulator complex protein lamtor5 [Plakobranchus ocellatus]|uniref:Late endosomal/lysosomal adaptor and MAPK and MTOR activator 5 n=1 Tax=Plakobranchus ocellatus TaxID=259542 RepID=A0AAV4C4W0_9GAST|nr:ragulator complex protein lamtor5 [Plakobranchus ocellatus]